MKLLQVLFYLSSISLTLGNQDFATRKEIKELRSQLEKTIFDAKCELAETKSELAETKSELADTKSELAETKSDLVDMRTEVTQLKAANQVLQKELDSLKVAFAHEDLSKPDPNRGGSIEDRVEYLEELSKLKHARTCDELRAYGVSKSG